MVDQGPEKSRPADTGEPSGSLSRRESSAKKDGERSIASWKQQALELEKIGKLPDSELSRQIQHLIEQRLIRAKELSSKDNPLGAKKDGEDKETAEQRDTDPTAETRPDRRGDRLEKRETSFKDHEKLYEQLIIHMQEGRKKWYETNHSIIKKEYDDSLVKATKKDALIAKTRFGGKSRTEGENGIKKAIDEFTQMLGDMLEDMALYQRVEKLDKTFANKRRQYKDNETDILEERKEAYRARDTQIEATYQKWRDYATDTSTKGGSGERLMEETIGQYSKFPEDIEFDTGLVYLLKPSLLKDALRIRNIVDEDPRYQSNPEAHKHMKNFFDDQLKRLSYQDQGIQATTLGHIKSEVPNRIDPSLLKKWSQEQGAPTSSDSGTGWLSEVIHL